MSHRSHPPRPLPWGCERRWTVLTVTIEVKYYPFRSTSAVEQVSVCRSVTVSALSLTPEVEGSGETGTRGSCSSTRGGSDTVVHLTGLLLSLGVPGVSDRNDMSDAQTPSRE